MTAENSDSSKGRARASPSRQSTRQRSPGAREASRLAATGAGWELQSGQRRSGVSSSVREQNARLWRQSRGNR